MALVLEEMEPARTMARAPGQLETAAAMGPALDPAEVETTSSAMARQQTTLLAAAATAQAMKPEMEPVVAPETASRHRLLARGIRSPAD